LAFLVSEVHLHELQHTAAELSFDEFLAQLPVRMSPTVLTPDHRRPSNFQGMSD
jgi:hypothetical protein